MKLKSIINTGPFIEINSLVMLYSEINLT